MPVFCLPWEGRWGVNLSREDALSLTWVPPNRPRLLSCFTKAAAALRSVAGSVLSLLARVVLVLEEGVSLVCLGSVQQRLATLV